MGMRELMDEDGENLAVRSFLAMYGTTSCSADRMKQHMAMAGWDGCWPDWVEGNREHLTKGGAQDWLRHLLALEPVELVVVIEDPDTALLRSENRELRAFLMRTVGGILPYTDDGELQDNSQHPSIDFLRDSVAQITAKLARRRDSEGREFGCAG